MKTRECREEEGGRRKEEGRRGRSKCKVKVISSFLQPLYGNLLFFIAVNLNVRDIFHLNGAVRP